MTIDEKINEIFKDESSPERIKMMAELKSLVSEREAIFKKLEDDNKALAEAYKNSLMGVKDNSKKEEINKAPEVKRFNFDEAFEKEVAKMLGDQK